MIFAFVASVRILSRDDTVGGIVGSSSCIVDLRFVIECTSIITNPFLIYQQQEFMSSTWSEYFFPYVKTQEEMQGEVSI